jgi:hypothetical protein
MISLPKDAQELTGDYSPIIKECCNRLELKFNGKWYRDAYKTIRVPPLIPLIWNSILNERQIPSLKELLNSLIMMNPEWKIDRYLTWCRLFQTTQSVVRELDVARICLENGIQVFKSYIADMEGIPGCGKIDLFLQYEGKIITVAVKHQNDKSPHDKRKYIDDKKVNCIFLIPNEKCNKDIHLMPEIDALKILNSIFELTQRK